MLKNPKAQTFKYRFFGHLQRVPPVWLKKSTKNRPSARKKWIPPRLLVPIDAFDGSIHIFLAGLSFFSIIPLKWQFDVPVPTKAAQRFQPVQVIFSYNLLLTLINHKIPIKSEFSEISRVNQIPTEIPICPICKWSPSHHSLCIRGRILNSISADDGRPLGIFLGAKGLWKSNQKLHIS